MSEHPVASLLPLLAVPMGSSMAHQGPDFSGRVLTAAPCSAGPRHPFTSPWLLALGWSSHHGHWDITDVCPTLVGTDPQEKVFLGPVPCPGDKSLSSLPGWRGVSPLHGAFWLHGCSGALRSHQNVVWVCLVWSGLLVNALPV